MTPSRDPTTLIFAGLYIVLALYAVGLWVFALLRTGMVFLLFLHRRGSRRYFHFSRQCSDAS
jgi:hypothetical protein